MYDSRVNDKKTLKTNNGLKNKKKFCGENSDVLQTIENFKIDVRHILYTNYWSAAMSQPNNLLKIC